MANSYSVMRSTKPFWKFNHQPGFLFLAATRSDVKCKREPSTALGKRWVTVRAHTHLQFSAGQDCWEVEEGKPPLLKEQPTYVFVVHNSAMNTTVYLHITSHLPCHGKFFFLILLLYLPASCLSPFSTPLLGIPSQPWSHAGPAQQQERCSSCQGLLEDAAESGFKPPPPHTTFSFYFWGAGISWDKETAAVLGKRNQSRLSNLWTISH